MSATDPKSREELVALAQRSRTETLSRNDQYELDKAVRAGVKGVKDARDKGK